MTNPPQNTSDENSNKSKPLNVAYKPDLSRLADSQSRFLKERLENDSVFFDSVVTKQDKPNEIRDAFSKFLSKGYPELIKELSLLQDDEWMTSVITPLRLQAIDRSFEKQSLTDKVIARLAGYYRLTSEQEKIIQEQLKHLQDEEIRSFESACNSRKTRTQKLQTISGIDIATLEERSKTSKPEKDFDLRSRVGKTFDKLDKRNQKALEKLCSYSHVSADEVFYATDSLEADEKLKILREFIPYVSLSELTKAKIVNYDDAKKQAWAILKKNHPQLPDVPSDDFDPDFSKITVSTANPAIKIDELVWKNRYLLADAANALNTIKDEARQEKLGEFGDLNLTPKGQKEDIHDEFIYKASRATGYHGLENLQKDGYILLETTDPNTREKNIQYFKVHRVDAGASLESKSIELINITGPNGNLEAEPKNVQESNIDRLTYIDLYSLLKSGRGRVNATFFDKPGFTAHTKEENLITYADLSETGEIKDTDALKKHLELVDSEGGKYGLEAGTCFSFESGEGKDKGLGTCRVTKIDEKKGTLELTNANKTSFTFKEFLQAFQALGAKRIAKFSNTKEMLTFLQQNAGDDIKKGFKEVSLSKEGELLDGEKGDSPKIEYLIGKNGEDAIKIEGWKGDEVKIATGKLTEEKGEKNKKTGAETTNRTVTLNHKPQWVKIETLYREINAIEAKPFKQPKVEIPTIGEETGKFNQKFSFLGAFESGLSIVQIMATFKYPKDVVLKFLKRNDEEHSAELALKLYGRFLPEDIRKNMEKNIDKARKKSADEFKEMITGWAHVKKILSKSNSERYELEGALLYTMGKAGTLYPEDLKDLQYTNGKPTYAWYIALGGTPNDKLFSATKRECETNKNAQGEPDPIPFTEELLVGKLLKVQGSNPKDISNPEKDRGKYNIKYKSRGGVDKDFAAAKSEGIKAGVDEGEKKIADEVTISGKLKSIFSSLKDGKYAAAFGGLSKLLDSHGKREEMYKMSILIALSGIGTKLDKEVTAKLPGFGKYPYPPLIFMNSPGDIKLFQNVCLELADKMGGKAKSDLTAAIGKVDMKERFEALEKFLSTPNGKTDNNGIIAEYLSGHDKKHEVFANKKDNNTFFQYYEKVSDKVKEHRTNQDAADKRVYTKKHSSLFWYDQSSEYIGNLHIDSQTTDLDEGHANNKKFKDALEIFKDVTKAANDANPEDKKKFKSQFDFAFQRVYFPARGVIQGKNKKNRSDLRFVTKMKESGIDLMATNDWTPAMLDAKSAEFKRFSEEQWRKLSEGGKVGTSGTTTLVNKSKLKVKDIVALTKKVTKWKEEERRRYWDDDFDQASGF